MKKRILVLVVGFLFIGVNVFAADGDLIVNGNATVNGNVGIGTTTPGAKLDVQGGSVKVGGIFITHVTGTNPTCPAGKGTFLMRKFVGKSCYCCDVNAGWSTTDGTCRCTVCDDYGNCGSLTCSSDWTEAVCMGN